MAEDKFHMQATPFI